MYRNKIIKLFKHSVNGGMIQRVDKQQEIAAFTGIELKVDLEWLNGVLIIGLVRYVLLLCNSITPGSYRALCQRTA